MYKFLQFLLTFVIFASLINNVDAHTNQICTSTGGEGSSCGSAKFMLTTYHNCPSSGNTPGTLHIQTPLGNILTFAFSSFCAMSGFSGIGPNANIPSNSLCSQELSNKCNNQNSDITCYYKPDGVNMIGAKGNEICLAGNTQKYNCAYYSTINNAVTGNYIVWTTGTDANLDPCNSYLDPTGKIPCDIDQYNKLTIPLSIEGCGKSCSGTPPTPSGTDPISNIFWSSNVDYDSCKAAYDGIRCSVTCPPSYSQSGSLYCEDGKWINSLVCVDQKYINYCHSGSDCSGNGITTDTNRQDGCDCSCNSGFVGSDCSIEVSKSPSKSPSKLPSNSPTNSPSNSPTNSPTNSPSKSPSNSPTNSPSNSPSNSPTKSPIHESSSSKGENKDLIAVYVLVPMFVIGLIIFACCRYRNKEEEVLEEEVLEEVNEEGLTDYYVMDDDKSVVV